MDVVLRRVGVVIIDDKLDILNILTFEAGVEWEWCDGSVRGVEKTKTEVRT